MAEYKLTHFNTRFLAEPIRFVLAYAGVDYEDERISLDQFRECKDSYMWNQLPQLKLDDNRVLSQSAAITQFLAQRLGLTGNNEWDAIKCVEISDCLRDMRSGWRKFFFQRNRDLRIAAKDGYIKGSIERFLKPMDKMIEDNGNKLLICDKVTWADLTLATTVGFLEDTVDTGVLDPYPNVRALKEEIFNTPQVKAYVEKRPKPDVSMLHALPLGV